MMKVVSTMTEYSGDGIKKLREDLSELFKKNKLLRSLDRYKITVYGKASQ